MGHVSRTGLRRILLVEDDVDVREILVEVLEHRGFSVVAATDGREALELVDDTQVSPDVIILDVMMPEMDGAQFLVELRQRPAFESVPVVVLSAAGQLGEKLIPPDAVSAWMRKPVELDDLLATMSSVCPDEERSDPDAALGRRAIAYLSRRQLEMDSLRSALVAEDFREIVAAAGRLTTTGRGFGFPGLADIGDRLRTAAALRNRPAVEHVLDAFSVMLSELTARSAEQPR